MLDSSHLLIKNIIINHVSSTLEGVPVDRGYLQADLENSQN